VLRVDPLLAAACGKDDPAGRERLNPRDVGKALAGKSTLNRLELTPPAVPRFPPDDSRRAVGGGLCRGLVR